MTPRLESNWRRYLSFFGSRPERDVDDELAFHVQARVDEYVAAGMEPNAARAATLQRLGDLTRYRGETLAIEQQEQRRRTMSDVLKGLGAVIELDPNFTPPRMLIQAAEISSTAAPPEHVRKLRASFTVVGPLLARLSCS